MKKTKTLILSIALVALATTSFAQLSSIKDRLFNKQSEKVVYITADYKTNETSRIESWMHDLRSWSTNRNSRDAYVAPVVAQTFIIENADVVYEEDLGMENWMTTPFDSNVAEEEISLESWMTAPFAVKQVIKVEEWML